jgi:hypothetical protein
VVEVISRYAGSSLPVQARQTVRGFILNLPGKWVSEKLFLFVHPKTFFFQKCT